MVLRARRSTVAILLSILLSVTAVSYAQVPYVKKSYFQNWGGLNDQLSSTEIADNEASEIQNIVFDTGGVISKRYGYTTVPSDNPQKVATGTAVAVTGITFYKQADGDRYLVAVCNNDGKATAMKKDFESGGGPEGSSWDNIDFIRLPTITNSTLSSFSIAEDKVVITMPAAAAVKPFVWTGTGKTTDLTTDTDCPNASINVYHKNHLFLAGDPAYYSRVYFSALDDITSYTATDFFDVQTNDGSRVRGMVSAFNSLYIFKDRSIWRLSGNERDSFILQKMIDDVGTLSHQSIGIAGNRIFFTTPQNDIAVYDGGYTVEYISTKISETVSGLNGERSPYTLGLAFPNDLEYYCAVSNGLATSNDLVLLYDITYGAWSKFVGIEPNAWCIGEDQYGDDVMYFGDYTGYVHTYPSTTYYDGNIATSAIAALYQTKWFKYSDLCLGDKYWRLLKTYALTEDGSSTTPQVLLRADMRRDYVEAGNTVEIDITSSGSKWDSAIWDVDTFGGTGLLVNRQELQLGTEMFQLEYSNEDVDVGFSILGFEIFLEPTNDRV